MCCFPVLSAEMQKTLVPSYCEDESAWIVTTQHKNITCANYLPEANWSMKRSCYQDHLEHPDTIFDVATQLLHNTRGLDVCNKCCRTCYEECCILHKQCPHKPLKEELSVSSSRRTLTTSATSQDTTTFFHTCNERYDCARQEYTEAIPEIVSEEITNTTIFGTLAVQLRIRIRMPIESFDIDERLRARDAISRKFHVPLWLVSINDVSNDQSNAEQFLEMSVSIGLMRPTLCVPVPCQQVHIIVSNLSFSELPGSEVVQAPVCSLCKAEQEFVFASAGTVDDPFSCRKECAAGYYQFKGLQSASCEPHSKQLCASTQFLQAGTSTSDALCVNCSSCEGSMFLAPCLPHRDTVCQSCPDPAANQYWIGNECTPACKAGFVWNTRKQECEFCAQTLCEPGLQAPAQRDNCTHCIACPPHPLQAHWSVQNDRFDCMWLCDENFELSDMGCVPKNYSTVTALAKLEPLCNPGHVAVNFQCVSCFQAAAEGFLRSQNLPQPADVDIKWQWLYGCNWRCMHAAGYWELRPESGTYWECSSEKRHTVMLRGVDNSWAAAPLANLSVIMGSRREAPSERRALYLILILLVSVPSFMLVCMVIVGVARLQWITTDISDESRPLLKV